MMVDRRVFPRFPGTLLPSLSVLTGRSTNVAVIDISDGGVLIETPVRVTPGEREMVVLDANATMKKAGSVERVEIIRLIPSVSYRTAIRFFAPISVLALTHSQRPVLRRASREAIGRFARWARELSGVHAVRVSFTCRSHPGTEPVLFAVPTSYYGDGRLLQVFFTLGALPTAAQFGQFRRMALLASELPDLDIVSSSIELASEEQLLQQTGTADLHFRLPRRKRFQTAHSTTQDRMQDDGSVILLGAFPNSVFTPSCQSRKAG